MTTKRAILLLPIAMILSLAFVFLSGKKAFDIHFQDTYYVISFRIYGIYLTILYLLLWALYYFTQKYLGYSLLSWGHIILSMLLLILPFMLLPKPLAINSFEEVRTPVFEMIILFLTLVSPIFYIANIIIGLKKSQK